MSRLFPSARAGARAIRDAYVRYREGFLAITRRAGDNFARRDRQAAQRDAFERLGLYRRTLEQLGHELEALAGGGLHDLGMWRALKALYAEAVEDFPDVELAETFFNSVTRHVLTTVGVDPEIEFVDLDFRRARYGPGSVVHATLVRSSTLAELLARLLRAARVPAPFADLERDAERAAAAIESAWRARTDTPLEAIDVVESVFYRGSGAYLVGRLRGAAELAPLVLALLHGEQGVELDAVLLSESEVSIVFSYTRSHFHVELPRPSDVVRFLSSIMPKKPIAELYISLGHTKHGKTELYRDVLGHLRRTLDPFEHAAGDTGMVMVVFTLKSHDYVFKVIRDEFAYPKTNTREDVMDRYQLVFQHDRAGRLIEAQEFEHLTFDRNRFSKALLEELADSAANNVSVSDREVVIHHLYIERRVRPLNLYLRESDEAAARAAILDYGQAIRDMARTNIFPGDMLLKNFGVTRHGRVIFYDYDELCLVTECTFRDLPAPSDFEQELAAEPWYYVDERDVFPEEFVHFLGLPGPLRRDFIAAHGEILTATFWRDLQARHGAGEVLDVFPYPPAKRLRTPREAAVEADET